MLVFVTGGSGVLGRLLVPGLRHVGHQVRAPASAELDLCDPGAVSSALAGVGAMFHLATRIPPPEQFTRPDA